MANRIWNVFYSILAFNLFLFFHGGVQGECEFPDIIQSEEDAGRVSPWIAMRQYSAQNMYNYEEELQIKVKGNKAVFHRVTDEKEEKLFERHCLRREPDNAYIVKHVDSSDQVSFACMKFISRGKNVVQVMASQLGDRLESTLCDRLEKVEWPWLANRKKEWVFCPVLGGYQFQIQDPTRNGAKVCAGWKQFRMESECMKGEGIKLFYPDDCSPFGTDRLRTESTRGGPMRGETLSCYAGWKEDDYIFMILLAPGQSVPQYTMRFPVSMTGEFIAYLYFNAVTPYEMRGVPPAGREIHYLELKMTMADSTACMDENEECSTFEEQGLCDRFQQDCKKSCGLCDPNEDITVPKCTLPNEYRKTWTLYDPLYTEDVTVGESDMRFDSRDSMVCRDKHPDKDMYKFVTKYENGCRPRYTCADFKQINSNVLRYRISPSTHDDRDINELCRFIDDDYPLKDSIRSEQYKHLVVKSEPVQPVPCGIDATIPFITSPGQVELDKSDTCGGNISDWNTQSCGLENKLTVYPGTCSGKIKRAEFECLAVIDETAEYVKLLLTRRKRRPEYNCWIITTYDEADSWIEGRLVHKMPTTQCTAQTRLDVFTDLSSETTFYLYDDQQSKVCAPTSPPPYIVITDETGKEIWRSTAATNHVESIYYVTVMSLVLLMTR